MALPYREKEDVNIFMNEYNEKLNKNRCISRLIENDNYLNDILEYNVTRATSLKVELNTSVYEKVQPSGTDLGENAAISPGMVPRLAGTEEESLSAYSTTVYDHHHRRYLTPDVMARNFSDDGISIHKEMTIDVVHVGRITNSSSINSAMDEIGNPKLGDGFQVPVVHRSRSKQGANGNTVSDIIRSYFVFERFQPRYIGSRYAYIYGGVWRV